MPEINISTAKTALLEKQLATSAITLDAFESAVAKHREQITAGVAAAVEALGVTVQDEDPKLRALRIEGEAHLQQRKPGKSAYQTLLDEERVIAAKQSLQGRAVRHVWKQNRVIYRKATGADVTGIREIEPGRYSVSLGCPVNPPLDKLIDKDEEKKAVSAYREKVGASPDGCKVFVTVAAGKKDKADAGA